MIAVAIVDHDPTWPNQFEQLAAALRRRLADADRLAPVFQQEGYTATSYRLDQLFRDYLRAHPRAAAAYAALKRALAERLGDDLAAYTELKAPACDLIVAATEDWAAGGHLGHDPHPSDRP